MTRHTWQHDPKFAQRTPRGSAGEAPRTHGTQRGANHRTDDDELLEDSRVTAIGVTVALLALVALLIGAVSCDPNPATSLFCAEALCEEGH